ncbi:hypothetical protein C8R45DRAFT_825347, partial [Mycena sanguinolenta]
VTRAEGLWFEDCGLIIQAESTVFRVSGAILATHSVVFRDMLSLPKPPNADNIDGCPFVVLPDAEKDVDSFLRAVFYPEYFESFPASTTFDIISSVLRLSHKYEIDSLRKRALIHLSHAHPTTLKEWDALSKAVPSWMSDWSPDEVDQDLLLGQLARPLGVDWILPTVFYRVCHSSLEDNIIGEDYFSKSDQCSYVQGLRYLVTTGAAEVLDFLWGPYPCPTPDACDVSRRRIHRRVERRRDNNPEISSEMPLELWKDHYRNSLNVCGFCRVAMEDAHAEAREKLWDKLPKIFRLPDWAELEKMKQEALQ